MVIILASAKTAAAPERFMGSRRIQLATPPQEKQILSRFLECLALAGGEGVRSTGAERWL